MRFISLFPLLLIGMIAIGCAPLPAYAVDSPNLMIMGEDADKDTVPRKSRVFRRVLDQLSNMLHDEGFDVYDETAVTLENFEQGRSRRTDAEIIDIAKMVRNPPIDVAVIFQIYASAKKKSYTTKVKTRVTGRILNVNSGQRMGNFEIKSPKHWNAPPNCKRECILEIVGDHSKDLAQEVGDVLAQKLAHMIPAESDGGDDDMGGGGGGMAMSYTLKFEGFSADDLDEFEEYLVIFSGYRSHRPTESMGRKHYYQYKSTISSAKLQRNIRKMLKKTNMKGRVSFSGNEYTIKKVKMRKERSRPANDEW
jgi:hypothetical protein